MNQNDEIRRLITNQKDEHTPHAFSNRSYGMDEFNTLVPMLWALPPEEIKRWLVLIDEVRETHFDCLSCSCKMVAYCQLITEGILPEEHQMYCMLYGSILAHRRHDDTHDYYAEVIESFQRSQARSQG